MIGQFSRQDKANQISILQEIVLQESNFDELETNPLPLKLFRDLFLEGAPWDVSQLINCKDEGMKYKYIWLFATFLNFKHMMSLSNYLELKK